MGHFCGATDTPILLKMMSRNQWQIGVHKGYLMFKGPIQLNFNGIKFHVFLCYGDVSVCIMI